MADELNIQKFIFLQDQQFCLVTEVGS